MYLPSNMASFWVSILYMLNFKGASPCLVYSWVLKNRHRLWLIWSDLGWRIFQTFLVLHFLLESPGQLWQFGWYWSCATDGIKSSYSWNKAWFEVILFGTIGTLWKSDFGNLPFCRCVFYWTWEDLDCNVGLSNSATTKVYSAKKSSWLLLFSYRFPSNWTKCNNDNVTQPLFINVLHYQIHQKKQVSKLFCFFVPKLSAMDNRCRPKEKSMRLAFFFLGKRFLPKLLTHSRFMTIKTLKELLVEHAHEKHTSK